MQVCRGFAALLVVFAHLHNIEHKYFATNFLGIFQYGVLGVDLFFVISGVVISAVTVGKFRNAHNARTFLYHRFARIYPIYWIYSGLVLAAYLYNPLWVNASGDHQVNILQSFLLIPTKVPMLLLQGWTLTYEIYFYLAFFLLLMFAPARHVAKILALWAAVIVLLTFVPFRGGPIASVLVSPAILEFLAGCAIFHIYRGGMLHPRAGVLLLAASAIWLAFVMWLTHAIHGSDAVWLEDSYKARAGLYGVFAVLFLLGMMELERSKAISFALPLVAIGDWSYSIYLSHTIVLKIFSHSIASFTHAVYAIWLVVACSVPAALAWGYLSFTYLERPIIALLYKPSTKPVLPYQPA